MIEEIRKLKPGDVFAVPCRIWSVDGGHLDIRLAFVMRGDGDVSIAPQIVRKELLSRARVLYSGHAPMHRTAVESFEKGLNDLWDGYTWDKEALELGLGAKPQDGSVSDSG